MVVSCRSLGQAPVKLLVNGLESFVGWIESTEEDSIVEVGLIFPQLIYLFDYDNKAMSLNIEQNSKSINRVFDYLLLFFNSSLIDVTLKSLVKLRAHSKCATIEEMKIEIDYASTNVSIRNT